MPSLSIIIIARNEAEDIRACLESVKWADEIIVLDSGSTDGTPAICREYTEKVYVTDWPGYGVQKNRALQKASGNWILSLDADERVSDILRQEILQTINSQETYVAYAIPFEATYCGKPIKYGAWHNKLHIRLFQRNCGQFTDALVHENITINGKIGKLKSPMIHHTYKSLEEMLDKLNRYSTDGAQQRLREGKTANFATALLHGSWTFLRSYFLQLGFLDGKAGFLIAVSNAEYNFYRYLKLIHLIQMSPEK